jgi:phosphoglycerate dehydrogenase-like enzyme
VRQDDLAQQWESERAANREWTTNATTAFAASVAEHLMVCLFRLLRAHVLTSSRSWRRLGRSSTSLTTGLFKCVLGGCLVVHR